MYPRTGLLILAGTRWYSRCYSFRARRRLRPHSCLSGKPLVYAFQILQIRSQCQNLGNYRAFNLIQSSIITPPGKNEERKKSFRKLKKKEVATGQATPTSPNEFIVMSVYIFSPIACTRVLSRMLRGDGWTKLSPAFSALCGWMYAVNLKMLIVGQRLSLSTCTIVERPCIPDSHLLWGFIPTTGLRTHDGHLSPGGLR